MAQELRISRQEIEFLKKARENVGPKGGQFRQCVPLLDMALEAIVNNCCFFFKTLHCTQLKHLPSNLIQSILNKIFAAEDFCVMHRQSMVMSLLGPNVAEFNHLLLWETKGRERGFDNLAYLCLKCPNLKKLRTIQCERYWSKLQPHLINFIGDLCVLKNLTSLVLHENNISSGKELRLIQENLVKLEHLQVNMEHLGLLEKDAVEAFAGMSNLKSLHLCLRGHIEEGSIEALVMCAGRITNLQTLFFNSSYYSAKFVKKYAAQFPQKKLHLLSPVEISGSFSIPWPNFLTCDELEVVVFYHEANSFADVSFPLKRLKLAKGKIDMIFQMLDTLGRSVERLCIDSPDNSEDSDTFKNLCLNEVLSRCPNLVNLAFDNTHNLSAFFDENISGIVPLRSEHFSNIQHLTLGDNDYIIPVNDANIELYSKIFCLATEVKYLKLEYVMFAKAGLRALTEDKNCFKKVLKLSVSTTDSHAVTECEFVFLFVKKMMLRSYVLKDIYVRSEYFPCDEEDDSSHAHKLAMQQCSNPIELCARALGISYTFNDEEFDI